MADNVQWIKLKVGMFDGNSFKKIKRAKIGGVSYRDKLTAVWFELLDLAGKSNQNGCLIDTNEIPYQSFEDIAIMLDREEKEIELCMRFFINEKMVEIIDDVYCLTNFVKYQNQEGLDRIREQKRIAQAKWRERTRLGLIGNKKDENVDKKTSTSNLLSYSTSISNSNSINNKEDTINNIIKYLNEKAGTNYRNVESNAKFIRARLKDYTEEDLKLVIDKKVKDWKGTEMQMYLRPETLFNATKFESYINGLNEVRNKKFNNERNYTKEEMNSLFQSIEDIEI